jgi:hypothetical protein
MSTYNEHPVYKATYDLLLEMFRFTKELNKVIYFNRIIQLRPRRATQEQYKFKRVAQPLTLRMQGAKPPQFAAIQ